MSIELHGSFAIHPGPWLLEEVIRPYNMDVPSAAKRLNMRLPALSRLLSGGIPLTPDVATRFETVFRVSAATMLRMQAAYDLAQTESRSDASHKERRPKPA